MSIKQCNNQPLWYICWRHPLCRVKVDSMENTRYNDEYVDENTYINMIESHRKSSKHFEKWLLKWYFTIPQKLFSMKNGLLSVFLKLNKILYAIRTLMVCLLKSEWILRACNSAQMRESTRSQYSFNRVSSGTGYNTNYQIKKIFLKPDVWEQLHFIVL